MRFGVLTDQSAPLDELRRTWEQLDDLGLDSIWVADHLIDPYRGPGTPWLEAWTCLATMAVSTSRARIGTLVSALSFRGPAVLAKSAATVDQLSGGRLVLGVGAGGSPLDYELTGIDRSGRGERLRAGVERLRSLLDDPALEPRAVGEPIPLIVGGHARETLRVIARHADGWNTYGGEIGQSPADARRVAAERNALLDSYCEEVGREPGEVRRSVLLGHRYIAETPWRSEEDFVEVARVWSGIGFDELIFFHPPDFMGWDPTVRPGVFERVAREVMPDLRGS